MTVNQSDLRLADLVTYLARNRRPIVACTLAGLLLGIGLSAAQPAEYVATTAVLAPPVPTHPASPDPLEPPPDDVTADTEGEILLSEEVVDRVAGVLGPRWTGGAVHRRLALTVPANTQVLEISFVGRTEEQARIGSEAAAEAYLATRGQLLSRQRQRRLNLIDQQVGELLARLTLLDQLVAQATPDEGKLLRRQRRSAALRLATLQSRAAEVTAEEIQPGEVLRLPAGAVRRSQVANPEVLPVSLAALGVLIGLVVARVRADRPLRRRAPLHEAPGGTHPGRLGGSPGRPTLTTVVGRP